MIRPITFNADGSMLIIHDDPPDGIAHGGTATPTFGFDHRLIVVNCPFPGCGSTSWWPIGGGADAPRGQEMFVRLVKRLGCPCGLVAPGAAMFLAQGHVKLWAERVDFVGRWQIKGTLAP